MTLADALVYDAPGEAGEAHWNEEAKALIAGIILAIVTSEPPATRTLATLRDRLTFAPAAFTAMLEARSEEHTSELQSLMRTSYAVFRLKKTHKEAGLPNLTQKTQQLWETEDARQFAHRRTHVR